jgi:chemotaxis protein MotB
VLQEIAFFVKDYSCELKIEGHTDNSPINSAAFSSNWELSLRRAMAVMRYLVERENIDPTRVWVAGYGEYKPAVRNTTAENRAKNRRVEIFLDWSNSTVVK